MRPRPGCRAADRPSCSKQSSRRQLASHDAGGADLDDLSRPPRAAAQWSRCRTRCRRGSRGGARPACAPGRWGERVEVVHLRAALAAHHHERQLLAGLGAWRQQAGRRIRGAPARVRTRTRRRQLDHVAHGQRERLGATRIAIGLPPTTVRCHRGPAQARSSRAPARPPGARRSCSTLMSYPPPGARRGRAAPAAEAVGLAATGSIDSPVARQPCSASMRRAAAPGRRQHVFRRQRVFMVCAVWLASSHGCGGSSSVIFSASRRERSRVRASRSS